MPHFLHLGNRLESKTQNIHITPLNLPLTLRVNLMPDYQSYCR